jgi:hypothetical protein
MPSWLVGFLQSVWRSDKYEYEFSLTRVAVCYTRPRAYFNTGENTTAETLSDNTASDSINEGVHNLSF